MGRDYLNRERVIVQGISKVLLENAMIVLFKWRNVAHNGIYFQYYRISEKIV